MSPQFHDVARWGDLAEESATRVVVEGVPIALVRAESQVYAVSDLCSHAEVSLSEGEVEGCFIECWLHGSQFDVRTGQPMSLPANSPIATYPTQLDGTGDDARVLVSLS